MVAFTQIAVPATAGRPFGWWLWKTAAAIACACGRRRPFCSIAGTDADNQFNHPCIPSNRQARCVRSLLPHTIPTEQVQGAPYVQEDPQLPIREAMTVKKI